MKITRVPPVYEPAKPGPRPPKKPSPQPKPKPKPKGVASTLQVRLPMGLMCDLLAKVEQLQKKSPEVDVSSYVRSVLRRAVK